MVIWADPYQLQILWRYCTENNYAMNAKNPDWDERDMIVLSKGHAGPGWYCALANCGFFDKEWLYTLNEGGTRLPSHPDRTKLRVLI